MISVNSSAIASLMRTGILVSPNPGSSITMAPMRAKTSMKAAASAGKSEMSMRICATVCHHPPMIRDEIRIIWLCSASAINGSVKISVTKIARIFGTKISVCSWIWVSAWNSDTTTPTTSPTTISGEDTTTMVQIASRATSRVSAPVIEHSYPHVRYRYCEERSDEAIQPFVPHLLRWIASRSLSSGAHSRDPLARNDDSDRHLHDVFVSRDHLVAHRHQCRHRDVGFGHRRHHIHDIGLAGCHRDRLRIGFSTGIEHAADGLLQHVAERRPGLFGALGNAGAVEDAGGRSIRICGN